MKSNGVLEKIKKEVERYNKSFEIEDIDLAKVERSEASLSIDDLVEEYNTVLKLELYQQLMENDNAFAAAIETLYCPRLRVRALTNDDGVTVGMDIYDENGNLNIVEKIIDLVDFDKYAGFTLAHERGWQYSLEKFNQLMCLKVALELGLSKARVDEIGKTFYLSKVAEKIKDGKTPTSNTQALKDLQNVIDMIIFEDDGNGKNKYKATSHDIAYIDHLLTKRGKSILTISVVNSKITRELVTAVLYRILTNGSYDVDYKKKK